MFGLTCSVFLSGPTIAFILAHPDAINAWRKLIGPTKVYKTQYEQPDSLRGQFGLTDTRNATHGSGMTFLVELKFECKFLFMEIYSLKKS